MSEMKYSARGWDIADKLDIADMGIDMPSAGIVRIEPRSHVVIDTGVVFNFPIFGKLRRLITRILLGVDIAGIGGLLWPRGRHDTLIMAGIVDPGYRGTIKIKIYNPTDRVQYFGNHDFIAQLVPTFAIGVMPKRVSVVEMNTERGDKGGINIVC